jgi:hypothetical protein
MLKQLVMSSVFAVTAVSTAVSPAFAGSTTFWGTSQVPNVACNIWGCPNAPLGAECTIHGCPPSAPLPVAPAPTTPTVIVLPSNNTNSGSRNSGMGECMDRIMFQEFRAKSGPDYENHYVFDLPSSLTNDQVKQSGFKYSSLGFNKHKQSVVRVQVKTAEQAVPVCR